MKVWVFASARNEIDSTLRRCAESVRTLHSENFLSLSQQSNRIEQNFSFRASTSTVIRCSIMTQYLNRGACRRSSQSQPQITEEEAKESNIGLPESGGLERAAQQSMRTTKEREWETQPNLGQKVNEDLMLKHQKGVFGFFIEVKWICLCGKFLRAKKSAHYRKVSLLMSRFDCLFITKMNVSGTAAEGGWRNGAEGHRQWKKSESKAINAFCDEICSSAIDKIIAFARLRRRLVQIAHSSKRSATHEHVRRFNIGLNRHLSYLLGEKRAFGENLKIRRPLVRARAGGSSSEMKRIISGAKVTSDERRATSTGIKTTKAMHANMSLVYLVSTFDRKHTHV